VTGHQPGINHPEARRLRLTPALRVLEREVVACERCPRLRAWCSKVAVEKRRAYRDQEYWGRPVPSFGDPNARLLLIGLAPGAHGANRTGRMFTGDRSGDFLYRALYETGFASQPDSVSRDDGMTLRDAWITAPVHCAPPDNKPLPSEVAACRGYLERELDLLKQVRVVVTLGSIGTGVYLSILKDRGLIESRAAFPFGHSRLHYTGKGQPALLCSYHPSQQNTSTGRLTDAMLREVFEKAREIVNGQGRTDR
jgi:uracil-DNA glycosylase family 4